mmetsp:Transcript_1979/g.3477  ORF Transcript_1979/g.3477 Transcript_1979/m.3477 type:complete len:91 (+) Transcript_1979:21-293(+)|eukprot:CAMPEP_0168618382 /NCGR_PEP_ID=MMETSP0449_2-20121227/6044_1 /TAXON_ID=1082188 /ORGANISM="Strombidium rassoulzadegani, Strain ras09" /LENGTH=90 /DNA_ID=CAMNT_0008659257 /DNA_START=14 /DNA_END=286 /DNA_ORIENTATION=-
MENYNLKEQQMIQTIKGAQSSNEELFKEGLKAQLLLSIMRKCTDDCQFKFGVWGLTEPTGIKGGLKVKKDQTCFKNCLVKDYKLTQLSLS